MGLMQPLPVDDGVVIPAHELSWTAVRASGPGGQNVNKVATKIELRFDLPKSSLPETVKQRLRQAQARRLDADGALVVVNQSTRSQTTNLERAREELSAAVRKALHPPKRRRPTRPTAGSKRRRLEAKRQQAEKKRERGQRFD